jgi:hypothetical protein
MSEVDITYSDSENSTAIQLYNGWKWKLQVYHKVQNIYIKHEAIWDNNNAVHMCKISLCYKMFQKIKWLTYITSFMFKDQKNELK